MQLWCLTRTFSAFCRWSTILCVRNDADWRKGRGCLQPNQGSWLSKRSPEGSPWGHLGLGAGPYITRSHHTKRVYFTKTSKNQDQVMALLFAFPMVETTLPQIALYGDEDLGGKWQRGTWQLQVINCTAIVSATRHNISHRYRQRRPGWLHPPSRFYISQIDLG